MILTTALAVSTVVHVTTSSGTSWATIFEVAAAVATLFALLLVPAAILFHRKVVRPLKWVLGTRAEDSPTGEEIMPIPHQLAQMRKSQLEIARRTEELDNNHGNSVKDTVRKTHRLALSTDRLLRQHLVDAAENERDIWRAIARAGGDPAPEHSSSSTATPAAG